MVSPELAPQLIGQDQALTLLARAVASQRVAPGYLFFGPAGVGRSIAAAQFAEQLLAPPGAADPTLQRRIRDRNHPDLLWVEPTYLHQGQRLTSTEAAAQGLKRKSPPQIRLEQIRELARFLSRPPLEATRAVVVIEAAERMAEAAANALLKTLEEPGRATLILIAESQQALLPTLVSRCQTIPFRRLGAEQLAQVLHQVGQPELLQSAEMVAIAQGSPGSAIASWQQLQALPPELLAAVAQPPITLRQALETARLINQSLDTETQLWLIDYLQSRYWQPSRPATARQVERLETARRYLLSFVQPRLVWEVVLMGMVEGEEGRG
ncbi:DNA polymerase III subunit delta', partial [Romeria aff. gracilis LEGE 07310]